MEDLSLSSDLNVIAAEINSYKSAAGHSFIEIGKRLLHVKENDLTYGDWQPFLNSIQMSNSQARRFMTIAAEYEMGKLPDVGQIGFSAMYEIATLPEDQRSEAVNEDGTAKTIREIRDLKRQNKQKENQLNQKDAEIERLKNQPPLVVEREVIPDDYSTLKKDNEDLNRQLNRVTSDLKIAHMKYDLLESSTREAKELEQKINSLKDREQSIAQKIEASDQLIQLEKQFNEFFDTRMAPMRFKPITEELYGTNATKRVRQLVDTASHWVEEMNRILPRNESKYAEIIEEE